jgi:hypothetical protein
MFGKYRIANTPATPTAHSFGSPSTSFLSPAIFATPTPSRPSGSKRKHIYLESDKENALPTPPMKKPYTPRRHPKEKLEIIFQAFAEVNWTLSEVLYQLFCVKDEDGKEIHRTDRHSKYTEHFLQGMGKYTAGMILECWLKSPDGRHSNVSSTTDLMYSTSTLYTEIKNARAALTSFAVQVVHSRLVAEAKQAMKPSSGLHASAKKGSQHIEWSDIGTATVSKVSQIIMMHQPLTWYYMMSIAQPENRGSDGVGERRPVSVVSHALTPVGRFMMSVYSGCYACHLIT